MLSCAEFAAVRGVAKKANVVDVTPAVWDVLNFKTDVVEAPGGRVPFGTVTAMKGWP